MQEKGYTIGGEQSGHMIFLEHATTGDGELTALQILDLLRRSGKKASELFGACRRFPQELINVPVRDNEAKQRVMTAGWLADAIAEKKAQMAGDGRILVRPSGTEALIRVMVEASDSALARSVASDLADLIKGREQ